jgi:DNA-binding beta-propeller fold protein YncE
MKVTGDLDLLPLAKPETIEMKGNIMTKQITIGGVAAVSAVFFAMAPPANPQTTREILHPSATPAGAIQLSLVGRYETGIFDAGGAEITAFDPASKRLFVINADSATVDIVSLDDPASPMLVDTIDIDELFSTGNVKASPNSVAVNGGLVVVAVQQAEEDNTQHPGLAAFFNTDGTLLDTATVGALPDMVTFTPDGERVLLANEGEPNQSYTHDPEGSVSVIRTENLRKGERLPPGHIRQATFTGFNKRKAELQAAGVRIYGPGATVAQDVEPEYITVSDDSKTAYVTLQENNAVAVIKVNAAKVEEIYPVGFKDWTASGLDASDRDDAINIAPWPVLGMYEPDAIASYRVGHTTYLVTANEGDARDWDAFAEEARVRDVTLDPVAFPNRDMLQEDAALGRLNITTTLGDTEGDGDFDQLYTLGGRSFSIWKVVHGDLIQVFDSADQFEQITASLLPENFNSDNAENNSFDDRSDNKGPEPEGVALGVVNGRTYAFIGLERIGGVMVYDITDPNSPAFVQYINTRDFNGDPEAGTAGDLGPEGLEFVPASASPNGEALLIVAHEISGSVAIFQID